MSWLKYIISATVLTFCTFALQAQNKGENSPVTLDIDAAARGPEIGRMHYGIFFEEINHAGDGGLYAELIQNRSFEDNTSTPTAWNAVGSAEMTLVSEGLMNEAQNEALKVSFKTKGDGISNSGFWGINIQEGTVYDFSAWVKNPGHWDGKLTIQLCSQDNTEIGKAEVSIDAAASQWTRITASITATGTDTAGKISITGSKAGTLVFDVVSLFPPTYKNRPNGCRIDLAEKLEAIHPAFMRFPGGCYVEGQQHNGKKNRFEWKKTVGPIHCRPGHMNVNWNYNVSDGLGFHEMLQLAEDIGAEPLFVVNIGLGHGWMVPYTEIGEYIDEALDALEYCNGDTTTVYGAMRAANGHPEPFNLRLLEIGNENYNYIFDSNNDQSDHYAERYKAFYDAVKSRYPETIIIGNVESWGTDNPTWRNRHKVDAVDEHYYRSPSWFVSQYEKYDTYDRSRPKVYIGEYAVTSNFGTNGNLNAALGEAVFMLGTERNSDMCLMASYAPIFVNENDQKWKPDMIRFNSSKSCGTPSYYVQQLMSNYTGTYNVQCREQGNNATIKGGFGFSTWTTQASYSHLRITDGNGKTIFKDNFKKPGKQWSNNGNWTIEGGKITQNDSSLQGAIISCSAATGNDYTLEVDAEKVSGREGFLIAFKYSDSDNYLWWNLGGWDNTKHGIEYCNNGAKSTITEVPGSIEAGRKYRIRIEVKGSHVKCFLDSKLVHEIDIPQKRRVYVSTTADSKSGKMFVKIVNPSPAAVATRVNISNATVNGGEQIVLGSARGTDENTLDNPMNVAPRSSKIAGCRTDGFDCAIAPYSLSIFVLNTEDSQRQTH